MVVTQCPECSALFRVSEGQMRLAQGKVRCGACLTVFDAQAHSLQPTSYVPDSRTRQEPKLESNTETGSRANRYPIQGTNARVIQFNQTLDSQLGAATDQSLGARQQQLPTPGFEADGIPQIEISAEPIVLHNREPSEANPVAVLFWTLCSLVALAGLLGQYLWFERATLASQPALAPFYQLACQRLPCDLNANQGLENLRPAQVILRPHQQFTDLISLAIRIRNEAAFAQPYPAIEVSFTDLKGNLVSRRTFQPAQYLGTANSKSTRLPAGLDIEVNLPLTTPGPEAVSYEIRLHQARVTDV